MDSQIVEMFSRHGVHLKQARGDELRTQCIFHDDKDKWGHLYVNTKDSVYFCHVCGEKGNGVTLAKYYGDVWVNEETGEIGEAYFDKLTVYRHAMEFYQAQLLENEPVYKYLKHERGLKAETIDKAKLGYAPMSGLVGHLKDKGITFKDMKQSGLVREDGGEFFRDKVIIPYLSSGHCVQLRGKQIGGKYLTPGGEEARLYGLDSLRGADEVMIAEGEFDSLILRQMGFACVAVPGARNFKEEWIGWFDGFRRIYVCFDADDPGEEGADRVKKILGKRVRIVHLPKPDGKDSLDVNDWYLQGPDDAREKFVELLAGSEGRRLQRASEIRRRWYEQKQSDDGIYFGLHPKWDHILKPGFLPGQLVTMLAKTGAGKTVTMLNIAYQNLHVPQLLIELEQTAEELYERMRRISLFYNPRLTDDDIDAMWQNVAICDENRLGGRDFEDLLSEFEEDEGQLPKLVYVDYLGYFARGYKGEEYTRLSDAVMDLKAMAKRHKVVIFSPHQVNRTARDGKPLESDMARGSGVIEETSDFCFALWKPYEAENNDGTEPGEVKIKVLKSRHGGKGTQFGLYMAPQSLAIVPNDNITYRNMVMNEFAQFEKGYLWPDIHEARKLTWRPLSTS
jgi:archaellum biogenesis ATPase FlaH